MNYQDKVLEFQLASGQPVHLKRELTKEELDFRDSLLREEIRELREAIVDNNRVEILDALCDIKYVNDGTANMIGYKHRDRYHIGIYGKYYIFNTTFNEYIEYMIERIEDGKCTDVEIINRFCYQLSFFLGFSLQNFKTALIRVHESNMSKFCNDVKTADRTQKFYNKQGIDTYIEPREKKFVVYREGDGKVLKSVDYYPVYLDDLV